MLLLKLEGVTLHSETSSHFVPCPFLTILLNFHTKLEKSTRDEVKPGISYLLLLENHSLLIPSLDYRGFSFFDYSLIQL